ncbi:MAG: glycosyltransferase family 2 protein [Candidatus Roizmanbacteria bacterium]
MKKLTVLIPAHDEEGCIEETIRAFHRELTKENIDHEILVVNDNSSDSTKTILLNLQKEIGELRSIDNHPPHGFGRAVAAGLESFSGDYVAIVMADMSDRPVDLVKYFRKTEQGYDCVFGSRFIPQARVVGYPIYKLILNRLTNNIIRLLFFISYNDVTNAFKLYSRQTINGLKPFLSQHFNLTVELPLKAIIRGYTYAVVPTNWTNRKVGFSKLKIKEMGGRYFFIILYCYLEKMLSSNDYQKSTHQRLPEK